MSKKLSIFLLSLIILFFALFSLKTLSALKKDNATSASNNIIVVPNNNALPNTSNINISALVQNNYIPLSNTEISKIEDLKNYLIGKFDRSKRNDFVLVSDSYTISDSKIYLRQEAYKSFLKMEKVASSEGISLKIISGFRNFIYQKSIWEKKWNGDVLVDGKNLKKSIPDELERAKKILEYSAMPGTSRHHWGTEIDMNNADPAYFDSEKGKKGYDWLVENASKFGFCQPYNKKSDSERTGYSEEKWHWSYFPISKELINDYVSLIKKDDIKGFSGDQYFSEMNIIADYVLGINPICI